MLEQYEDVVEDWYFHHQDQRLESFLCQGHVLKTSEQGGLRLLPRFYNFQQVQSDSENRVKMSL